MKFKKFAEYLQKLEETTKRLEMTDILSSLISDLDVEESDKALYLASGYLEAPFKSEKLNIADKMMIKILSQTVATEKNPNQKEDVEKLFKQKGDIGDVAYELLQNNKESSDLTIKEVYSKLTEIAQEEGGGSQDSKIFKTSKLLKDLDQMSAKYVVRIIVGTTRLGFTELTIIAALANYLGDKNLAKNIEEVYNIHPDIGLITKTVKEHGIKGLEKINIETGVPVLSQKAQRVSGMEEALERIGSLWAEYKFDGTRVQLHLDRKKEIKGKIDAQNDLFGLNNNEKSHILIKTYTRNLEETTHQYPEIIEAAEKYVDAESVILDGEAIGYNKETGDFLPFQETIQRKRKYNIAETAKNVPLKYFVFDILYLNGKSLISKPLKERREILGKIIKPNEVIHVDEYLETAEFEELQEYFEIAKEKGLEGLVVKNPRDSYQAGARSYSWIKLKKADEKLLDDSVDLVVLGYYAGKGVRSKFGIGGFLVGVYDQKEDKYKTISKIGTGLTEEDWVKIKKMADKVKIAKKPVNVEIDKIMEPDTYTKPSIVVETGADEISISPTHTAGYALRFPRLLKFREDKSPTEATTLDEIKKMFKNQRKL